VTANRIQEQHIIMVLDFDSGVINLAVVAVPGPLYSIHMTVFNKYFKMKIIGLWRGNQSLTYRRSYGERGIGMIGF
jgi:hypothetical protein